MFRSLTVVCAVTILSWQAFAKPTSIRPREEKQPAVVILSPASVPLATGAAPPDLMAGGSVCSVPSCRPKSLIDDRDHAPAGYFPLPPGSWLERISTLVRFLMN